MESVIDGQREGDRSQDGQYDQEEGPQRVYQQRGRLEEEFQQFAEPSPDFLAEFVYLLLSVHVYHRVHVPQRPAQFVQPLVIRLVAHKEGLRRVTQHRLAFQPVFLFLVFPHVEGLLFDQGGSRFAYGRKNPVDCAQYHSRKKHDAKPQHEGPEQGEHVYRLGPGKGLPYPVGHIEQGTEARHSLRYRSHVFTQRHHFIIQRAQKLVKVCPVY